MAVAAGLQQPHGPHELYLLELLWTWVEHGDSCPLWAYQEISARCDFLAENKMKDNRVDDVWRRVGYQFGFNVSPIGKSGGLTF